MEAGFRLCVVPERTSDGQGRFHPIGGFELRRRDYVALGIESQRDKERQEARRESCYRPTGIAVACVVSPGNSRVKPCASLGTSNVR